MVGGRWGRGIAGHQAPQSRQHRSGPLPGPESLTRQSYIGSLTGTARPLDSVPCLFLAHGMAKDDEPIRPMILGNMRQNGVRGLFVTCSSCGYHSEVNVDAWPDDTSRCRRSARACAVASAASSALRRDRIGASGRTDCRAAPGDDGWAS
jgi:hypothetical protein